MARRRQSWLMQAQRSAAEKERNRLQHQRAALALQQAQVRAIRQWEIQQERDEKKRRAMLAELHAQEAGERSAHLAAIVDELQTILRSGLRRSPAVDFDSLKVPPPPPEWHPERLPQPEPPPTLEAFLPPTPHGVAKLVPGAVQRHQKATEEATAKHKQAFGEWQSRDSMRQLTLASAEAEYRRAGEAASAAAAQQAAEVSEFQNAYTAGEPSAVSRYVALVLERSQLPEGLPVSRRVAYSPQSRQIVLEVDLPTIDVVPVEREFRYVKSRDAVEPVARTDRDRRAVYLNVIAQTTLRTVWEVFASDSGRLVDSLVINGFVSTINPSTGLGVRPCLITLRTTADTVQQLDLSRVDPIACLKQLNAGVSASPAELAPVRPILEFNMVDPRFIEETDILSTLDERPNLMEISPSEFESLITNLFGKMGLDTKLTRPSRDGGVDCVAYDARPIVGGKVVIQAKRYKNTVGVSAVRDLFGTTINEGASKGILVTTSGYGKASFDFAANKPLELLDGANLLALLADHAGIQARIEPPEDWVHPTEEGA